jgi:hypothetical protein
MRANLRIILIQNYNKNHMGIDNFPSFKNIVPSSEGVKKSSIEKANEPDIYSRAKDGIVDICKKFQDPRARVAEIIRRIDPFIKYIDKAVLPEAKINDIINRLEECVAIDDESEFIYTITVVIKPLLDLRVKHAYEFEAAQARVMNETSDFKEINRLVSYGKDGATIHLHAPPGKTVENKITFYRQALRDLAVIINNDPEIQEIDASSFLVAEHPELFTRLGFRVEEVTDEFRQAHFANEERDIKIAKIDREDFLKKFLKR